MGAKAADWKIEDAKRVSQSKLWDIQRNYFHSKGIDAWKGEVPFYVSSNCYIAHAYAQMVFRLIQQTLQKKPNQQHAFQIIELGAGTGKFSYYFLQFFLDLCAARQLPFTFCYTLTDFSEKMIDSIKNNHSFTQLNSKLTANQQVEFKVWDFENEQESAQSVLKDNYIPIIIANYVFDCIRQDKFYIENRVLNEVQIALGNRYLNFNIEKPQSLKEIDFKESYIPVNADTYYEESKLNTILKDYSQKMASGTEFCIPVGAFNFIDLLDKTKPYYLIIGDKGLSSIQDFEATKKRELMSYDGCYSFLLNYDALNQYFDQIGGAYIGTDYVYTFGVHLYGNAPVKHIIQEENIDFKLCFGQFGPKEFLSLCQEYQGSCYRFKLDSLIDFIKLSHYDPDAYGIIHDRLIELVPAINDYNKPNILFTLDNVEKNIYVLGGSFDTYNLLGIFYQVLGDLNKAENLFLKSIAVLGPSAPVYHNLGILYAKNKDRNAAILYLEKSLEIEKKNSIAKRKLGVLKGGIWSRLIIPLSKVAAIFGVILLIYLFIRWS
jgi:tetratricopeptide (TPR) repeat protein